MPPAPRKTLNLDETLVCRRLMIDYVLERSMQVFARAADEALAAPSLGPPPPAERPAPEPAAPTPSPRAPDLHDRAETDPDAVPARAPTAAELMLRVGHLIRHLAALDVRLARDQHERTDRCRVPPRDPRRALLRENLRRCIDPALDRTLKAELMRDIDREIEVQIATAPNNEVPIGELFCIAAQKLGLQEAGWKNIQTAILDFYSNEPWTPDPPPDPRSATMRLSYAFDPPQWVPKDPWMFEGAPKPWHTIPPRDEPPHDDLPPAPDDPPPPDD